LHGPASRPQHLLPRPRPARSLGLAFAVLLVRSRRPESAAGASACDPIPGRESGQAATVGGIHHRLSRDDAVPRLLRGEAVLLPVVRWCQGLPTATAAARSAAAPGGTGESRLRSESKRGLMIDVHL